MPNNKIILNGEVLIDLTEDTATEADVAKGKTFHRADGLMVEGTLKPSSGGGGGENAKFVNFYDYDGTLLHQYTVEEAQELTELPELPSHDGLVCQGWNYTLAKIKAQGDAVNVGAMYITDDGKTRLYISIVSDGRMTVPICFGQTVANGVTVDWGDGLSETFTGTGTMYPTHEYSAVGDYVITLAPQDGCTLTLGGGDSNKGVVGGTSTSETYLHIYCDMLKKAELGNNISFANSAFAYCYSLASVTIPSSVTSIGTSAFTSCYSLKSVTIPSSVTTIGSSIFMYCYSLTSVTIPSSVKTIGDSMFQGCYNLNSVTLSPSLTAIGSYTFQECRSLTSVVIHHGVKSIGYNAFYNCYSLTSVTIPSSVTSIGTSAFPSCYSLTSVTIPSSVKTIGDSAFSGCSGLTSVTFAHGISVTLGSSSFYACRSLGSIVMPIISSFSSNYFRGCTGIAYLDFTHYSSVPTLGNTSYITDTNSDCKIRVPAALYDEWIVATNWAAIADRIVAV